MGCGLSPKPGVGSSGRADLESHNDSGHASQLPGYGGINILASDRLRRPYFGKMSIRTLNEVFLTVVDRNSDRVVLTREGEVWQPISSAQLQSWVYSAARQLQAWGI